MVEERKMFEEELERVWTRDKETQGEKTLIPNKIITFICNVTVIA